MTELSAGAWRLYCFLARCRNQTSGQCNPSVRTSAEAIDVHPKNIFKLRNELATAGWARFNGDHATALFGIGSSKNTTIAVDSKADTPTGSKNTTNQAKSSKNATTESQKHYSAVAKTLPDGSKNATAYKEEQDERTRLKEQDKQHAGAPRESRFSAEQITQYIKATKQHVYSVSGLTRYLKSNGEEDELIAKWIEAEELKEKLKAKALENAANLEKTFPWDEWINNLIHFNDRGKLEMERAEIEKRGGPKEPWEFRVFEYLNAATEAQ